MERLPGGLLLEAARPVVFCPGIFTISYLCWHG
jgi:hypothetical protein